MDCSSPRTKDPIEWIETCPDFSWKMAEQMREWILAWEPDLTEAIKWNMLCFSGRKLVCGLSACKTHLGVAFFRGTELPDPAGLFSPDDGMNTNIRSLRLTTLEKFDKRAFRRMLRAAVALDEDPTVPPVPKVKREPWPVPDFFAAALAGKKHAQAAEFFHSLKPTYQREYLVWVSTAKQAETRERRLRETLAALKAGRKWAQRKLA